MQWGTQYTVGMQYAVGTPYPVGMQYAVGVSAKRSTHTMDLANMGGWSHYLECKRSNSTQWGMQYAVGVGAKSTLCEMTFLHQHLLRTVSSLHGV